ncbi:MAG: (2Fe-2S)-binding protein [Candidatus Omnitrophica bacterium]|nr:(2Fe-2S)-binding protein [Candidatus Omnitrophota bacterium]
MFVKLKINKTVYTLDLMGHETLLEVLRDNLGLTGTKHGCDEAECGACTVLVNGKSVLSCVSLACDLEGEEITTIEGLAQGDKLHPLQEAFLEKGAVQCGFCIPGMVLSSKALLDKNPSPSKEEIKIGLDGNICRCAGYQKIFEAVESAASELKKNNVK